MFCSLQLKNAGAKDICSNIMQYNKSKKKKTRGYQCHRTAVMITMLFTTNSIKAVMLIFTASNMELNNAKWGTLCSKIIIREITGLPGS